MNEKEFVVELEKLGIAATSKQMASLEKYYLFLKMENDKYNLTAITEKDKVYLKHFYDSLTIIKAINLKDQTICDIGTGAGFPGVVLKIFFPNLKVTLVDSSLKKTTFLEKLISELDLIDIEVIQSRVEDFSQSNEEKYNLVVVRAVAPLNIVLELSAKITKIHGKIVCMKANISQEIIKGEKAAIILGLEKSNQEAFSLPFENSVRTILVYEKQRKTDSKYPRAYSLIKQRPL